MLYELVFFPGTLPLADGRGRRIHNTFTQCFYMPVLWRRDSLTRKYFHTEILQRYTIMFFLHRHFFTHTCTHTHTHTRACFNRDVFKHTRFYTEIVVHRNSFTQRCFHTEMVSHTETLLHRDDLTLSSFTHRYHDKQRCFYKRMGLHEELLYTDVFTQAYFCMISDGRCKTTISRVGDRGGFIPAFPELQACRFRIRQSRQKPDRWHTYIYIYI